MACGSSTDTGSPSTPPANAGRCSSRSATAAPCSPTSSSRSISTVRRSSWSNDSARRTSPSSRSSAPSSIDPSSPITSRRCTSTRSSRRSLPRWRGSTSWFTSCASGARGTVSRPINRSPVTCSKRRTRCSKRSSISTPRRARATNISRRSSAISSSRSASTPRSRVRRAPSRSPTWPAPCTTSSCSAIRTCSATPPPTRRKR